MCCHTQSPESKSPVKLPKLSTVITSKLFDGVALHRGTSFNANTLEGPISGFMVSTVAGPVLPSLNFYPNEKEWTEGKALKTIHDFVVYELPRVGPDTYFGSWLDTETGKVYVDISKNIQDIDEALNLGISRNEIAIWDVINNREIRLKYPEK